MKKELVKLNQETTIIPTSEELQITLTKSLKQIDKKLKNITGDVNYVYKAQAAFKLNENDSNNINIQTCIDLVYLIKALAMCKRLEKEYNQQAEELGLKEYPVCLWLSVPVSYFISDLTFRIKLVANQALINTLNQSKKELSEFLSSEQKLFNALGKVSIILD